LAQGPHRRPDLRAGLHHPQQQVRLRHPRQLRDHVLRRPAEAARRQLLGLAEDRAVQGVIAGTWPHVSATWTHNRATRSVGLPLPTWGEGWGEGVTVGRWVIKRP